MRHQCYSVVFMASHHNTWCFFNFPYLQLYRSCFYAQSRNPENWWVSCKWYKLLKPLCYYVYKDSIDKIRGSSSFILKWLKLIQSNILMMIKQCGNGTWDDCTTVSLNVKSVHGLVTFRAGWDGRGGRSWGESGEKKEKKRYRGWLVGRKGGGIEAMTEFRFAACTMTICCSLNHKNKCTAPHT